MARNIENAAGVGLTILIVTQIPQLYANLLPYPLEMRKYDPKGEDAKSARGSEIHATAVAVGLGFAGTLITQTPWPFFAAVLMAAVLCYHYEGAIKHDSTGMGI